MNLKYVDGAPPPPRPPGTPALHEWDLVDRQYVDRSTADTWTEGRAVAHYRTL